MTDHWTAADFERWLALQLGLGWKVRNPESVTKVRAAFRKGATLCAPFRQASTNSPSPLPGPLSS